MNHLKDIKNTVYRIQYKDPQQKFCPQCRGTKIFPKIQYGILPPQYKCEDCGYEGYIILEKEDE